MSNPYTLYDLAQAYVDFFDHILDPEFDEQCLQDTLESLDGTIELKVENGIGLIKSLESLESGFDSEIKRLTARRNTIRNRIQQIKDWYKFNLETMQMTKIETKRGTMSIQKSIPRLVVDNPDTLPEGYKILVPATFNIDSDSLKNDLKRGIEVDGAHLEQGSHLRIR